MTEGTEKTETGAKRVLGLDTVRALAAFSVCVAHIAGSNIPEPLRYLFTGAPAVIAFFVVSGFCIHYPYRKRAFDTAPFLAARAVRILIPSTVAMIVAKPIGMQGFNFIEGSILWSVTCEFFYYAGYPLFRKITRAIGWPILTAISFAVSYAVVLAIGSNKGGAIHIYGWYLNWIVMLPAWLIGATLADQFSITRRFPLVWLWRGVVAVTAAVLYWATDNTKAGFYLTLNPFAFLIAAWILAEISAARAKPIALLEWAGKWSYSLYLVHTIVSYASVVYLHKTSLLFHFPAIFAVTIAFYLLVEKPSHQLAKRVFKTLSQPLPRLSTQP